MEPRSLLLVQNDAQVAGAFDLFFTSRGFATSVAATMPDARRRAILEPPDAIVIGHEDDIVDAERLTPELRALLAPREPPIVVVTPRASRVFHAMATVLRWPCHPRTILAAIRSALRR